MAPPCTLPTDALAREFCRHLTDPQNAYGVSPQNLDEGVQAVQIQRTGEKTQKDFFTRLVTKGKDNGQTSPAEVYQKILELTPRQPGLARLLKGKLEIPWLPSTQQDHSKDFEKLAAWLSEEITFLKNKLAHQGLKPESFAYTLAMGEGLFEAMIGPRGKASVHGTHLGLTADDELEKPEKSLGEIYRQRKANCLEFTLLFLWAAQRAGIEVVPVASYRDVTGKTEDHVMVGFKNPRTKKIERVADIVMGLFAKPVEDEIFGEIPSLELWAQWFNAQGWKGMEMSRAESYVDQALHMVPDNFLFLYNKGHYRLQAKDYIAAKTYFLASIKVHPNYPYNYQGLYKAAEGLGDHKLAHWAEARYFALPENKNKDEE